MSAVREMARRIANGGPLRKISNGYKVRCPAHEDVEPSLALSEGTDQPVVLYCHAGCTTEAVMAAAGLSWDEVSNEVGRAEDVPQVPRRDVERYVYTDEHGKPIFRVVRTEPKGFYQQHTVDGKNWDNGLGTRKPVLYRLPQVLAAIERGDSVWVVEGEKDVHALEKLGVVATCNPGGAGKWREDYSAVLAQAPMVFGVVDQDQARPDGSNPGLDHMLTIRDGVRAQGGKVRLLRPAVGKDSHDHVEQGYGLTDFKADPNTRARPAGATHTELATRFFEPITWAVKDLLPSGLAILAGSPKVGKSWCALDIALGVAAGGRALSQCEVTRGDVIYLAREDNDRRLRSRSDLILGQQGLYLDNIEFHSLDSEWPIGTANLAALAEWAAEAAEPRLVVIDTLAKVEPIFDQQGDRYKQEYAVMSGYKRLADKFGMTVLLIHHDRKAASDDGDWTMKFSGSRGITGAADTLLYLEAQRGAREGVLHVTGRDVADEDVPMVKAGPLWLAAEAPASAYQ